MPKRKAHREPRLPVQQLAILAICRFAEPVALTSVYPYLPEMIKSFGVKENKVAKWAGLMSFIFSISQCLTAVLWGRASDTFGRKPTILTGLTCTMIASLLFGVSTSLPMAMVARALAGGFNGNVGIIRTMVAEMVTEKELQPKAFSVMPLVWNLGSIFGPSFGGLLAKPAENLPALFGNNKFLIRFPFALPNIVASALFTIGICTGILFLKETLETKKHKTDWGRALGARLVSFFQTTFRLDNPTNHKPFHRSHPSYDEAASSLLRPSTGSSSKAISTAKPILPRPTLIEVFTRQSVINLISYTLLALHSSAYDQLLPIFMNHHRQIPTSDNTSLPFKFGGGFGIGNARIGTMFTIYGICGFFVQFLVFPPIARKYGVLNCFKCCGVVFPLVCFATPYTALIQTPLVQQGVMLAIMLVKCVAVIFAFPCSVILLTNSAVSLRILGTLNGFAVSISAIGRAVGPAMAGGSSSWGDERGYVITAWWLLGVIACFGAIPIWFLVEMDGFSKNADDSSDSSDSEEDDLDSLPYIAEDREGEILEGDEVLTWDADEEPLHTVEGPALSRVSSRKIVDGKKYSVDYSVDGSFAGSSTGKRSSVDGRRDSLSGFERRMSSPIGLRGASIGPGGGRRLSNALGATNVGHGTGGSSFH